MSYIALHSARGVSLVAHQFVELLLAEVGEVVVFIESAGVHVSAELEEVLVGASKLRESVLVLLDSSIASVEVGNPLHEFVFDA